MTQDVNGNPSYMDDVEPILPDGWKPGDDIFADAVDTKDEAPMSDGSSDDDALLALLNENDGSKETESAPTTGDSTDEAQPSADDAQTKPDGAAPTVSPRILKLKVNHKDMEIDLNATSDEDLAALVQKGYAFEAMKDAENKRKYREAYQAEIEAGMTENVAKMVAAGAAGGKSYSLEDEEEQPTEPVEPVEPTAVSRDFNQEVAMLKALYPDFKVMPQEVMDAYNNGKDKGLPLYAAYGAYLRKQEAKTVADLRKENQILRQNAASAAKAPITGVSGSGDTTPGKEDPFIKGFDADPW